eukprot:s1486_g21.t1
MLETAVIHIMVYRDLFDKEWTLLTKGPVKLLQTMLPSLRRCADDGCSGQRPLFHPVCGEEVAQVILDAWSWRWATHENKQVPMDQAQTFSVFLRISLSALHEVFSLSGWHGVSVEPRPDSKQNAHPSFAVVWLQKGTAIAQALDYKRRHETVVGIARMNHKLGSSNTAQTRIAALEDRLLSQVQKIAEPAPPGLEYEDMDTDVMARQASEIVRQQNEKFATWFNDIGTRFCGIDGKMQAQQARLDEMQQALATQGAATQRLQTEVSSLQSSFQAELKAGLEAQTARLESLLEKRPRTS